MRTVTVVAESIKPERLFAVCVDVSKAKLDIFSRYRGADGQLRELTEQIANRTGQIDRLLKELHRESQAEGFTAHLLVCEPSGGFEKRLLACAHALGWRTAYASGEAVCKASIIESNDTGKSDQKDPRIMADLVALNKLLTVRFLPPPYAQLRQLNRLYEAESNALAQVKNQLHAEVAQLFSGFADNQQLFQPTGRALFACYQLDPYRIVAAGWKRFFATIKRRVKFAHLETLERLYHAAESAALHQLPDWRIALHHQRLAEHYEDLDRHQERKDAYRQAMVELFATTPESAAFVPTGVAPFAFARLIAETGPLADFRSKRALYRYLGINLRPRSSGTHVGQLKLSKKGRALGRKVLWQLVHFHLIKSGQLYADYHRRKKADLASGRKATVAAMRHAIGLLWGLSRATTPFAVERIFAQRLAA